MSSHDPEHTRGLPRRAIPFLWASGFGLVHVALPWGLSHLSTRHGWDPRGAGPFNLAALSLVALGLLGVAWTMAMHYRRAPARVVWERAPGYLIRRGPYAWSRNPMYLAELVLWLGWALYYGSALVALATLLLAVGFAAIVVPREERSIEARFGEDYRQYKKRVSRWFGRRS